MPVPAGSMQSPIIRGERDAMNDQEPKAERITVAEAYRRVREAITNNEEPNRFPDLTSLCMSATMREVGIDEEIDWADEPVQPSNAFMHVDEAGKERAIREIPESFRAFCAATNVVPRSLLNPWSAPPYVGGVSSFEDKSYDIAISEYEKWSAPYMQKTIPRQTGDGGNDQASGATDQSESGEVNAANWKVQARMIGDALDARDMANNAYDGLRNLSRRIEAEMRLRSHFGPRGPLSAATILREALSGDQWQRRRKV